MSKLKVYNSLTRKKEVFKPINPPNVLMYVCGPTVQGPMHLGHARTYISFDLIYRYLKMLNYDVKFVMNITDIHDDIIKKAQQENKTIFEISEKYTEAFFRDMDALKIKKANIYPKVTENIPKIIEMVKILLKKGFAYETEDGVYFDVSKFKDYGKLSGMKLDVKKETGKRIQTDKYEKNEVIDFALWKKQKPGEPAWDSPWGKGRPGWHIECSVLSKTYLDDQIDIHGGGMDLKFPHHENEIAQSEASSGKKPFVKYWIHTGFLTVNSQKMSKSLGNFITIPEILEKYSPEQIRFLILSNHYSSRLDFNESLIKNSKKQLEKINNVISLLLNKDVDFENPDFEKEITEKTKEFFSALNDDFNTPKALSVLFELIKEIYKVENENSLGKDNIKSLLNFFKEINTLFDCFSFKKIEIPKEVQDLVKRREKLRKEKKWNEADKVRFLILQKGFIVEDGPNGPVVKKS